MIGEHAPGFRSQSPADALAATHHLYLSHGQAVPVLRRNSPDAKVGITLNLTPADPATSKADDLEATTFFDGWFNRWYLDPLYRGSYPADIVAAYESVMPEIAPGDMERIAAPLDFLGVNYYSRAVIKANDD